MTLQLHALSLDANDPPLLAAFWSGVLQREVVTEPGGALALVPDDAGGFRFRFVPVTTDKWGPNHVHFDLTSTSFVDQEEIVARALRLGGRHLDVGQTPDEDHVVLADPEGNEFCVTGPGNAFLAGCGRIGALSSDGLPDVGHFWSRALGWPLVWDQDSETAIQSPQGGTKVTWGGPPVAPKLGKNRFHFDLAPPVGGDQAAEIERLVALGAKRIETGQVDLDWVVLADPGGNEFCVLTPRQD